MSTAGSNMSTASRDFSDTLIFGQNSGEKHSQLKRQELYVTTPNRSVKKIFEIACDKIRLSRPNNRKIRYYDCARALDEEPSKVIGCKLLSSEQKLNRTNHLRESERIQEDSRRSFHCPAVEKYLEDVSLCLHQPLSALSNWYKVPVRSGLAKSGHRFPPLSHIRCHWDSQQGKPNYAICFCMSSDCKARTWLSKDGQVKKGKWLRWRTIAKHTKKDTELIQEKILPPISPMSIELKRNQAPPRPVGGMVVT
ncbi:hypothetical protein DFH09DRAFT_1068643 [Mycena vulgaris]|nr:hypothetical protein DFH09DRAFT_1068643 [Mycena vulgaris]